MKKSLWEKRRHEMSKRGFYVFVFLSLLVPAILTIQGTNVNAQSGCCTNPNRNTCEDNTPAEICCPSSDPAIPFYNQQDCLSQYFKAGVACSDPSLGGACEQGCCYSSGQCSNFQPKLQCTKTDGTFYSGTCDQQQICDTGCCVSDFQGSNICTDNVLKGACQQGLVQQGATYKNFYKIGTYSNCQSFCGIIVYEGNLTGYVKDSGTSQFISGVTVDANGKFATTNSFGYYYVSGISSGNITVSYSKDGYVTKQEKTEILTSRTSSINTTIEPAQKATLAGTVRDNAGNPMATATVSVGTLAEATKIDGSYLIQNIPFGDYNVVASKIGYLQQTKQISLQTSEKQTLDFSLAQANVGTIRGKITDIFGTAVQGAKISLLQNNIETYSNISSATGDYEIRTVISGNYTVIISKAGYQTATTIKEILRQAITTADFSIRKTYQPCNNNGVCEANEYCEDGISEGCPDIVCQASYSCIDAKCVARFNYTNEPDPKQCDATTKSGLCTSAPCYCNEQSLCVNSCSPLGSCNYQTNQYCNTTTFKFQTFDVKQTAQLSSYCRVCSGDTTDCGSYCPPSPNNCDYSNHLWCDDTTLPKKWVSKDTLGTGKYCDYCAGDNICQPTNACTSTVGNKCCSACTSDVVSQGYFPAYDYPKGCTSSTQGKCCAVCQTKVSCPLQNQCSSASQCTSTGGTLIVNAITNPETSYCCSQQCVVPQCAPNIQVSQNSAGSCICGGQAYSTQTTAGYCCITAAGTVYQTSSCVPYANITGQVMYGATGLKNIKVQAVNTFYSATTDSLGKYFIQNIPVGIYNLTASDPAGIYSTNSTINYVVNQGLNRLNFGLIPVSGNCDKGTPPNSGFKASNVRGSVDIILSWANPCPLQITRYSVQRTSPSSFIGGTIFLPTSFFAYADSRTSWSTEYNYTIQTYYTDGRIVVETASAFTGDQRCDGKINETVEFCAENAEAKKVLRAKCDSGNTVKIIQNCTDVYSDSMCSIYIDQSYCTRKKNCEELGLPSSSPFGIFDRKETCLYDYTNSIPNYCYYDTTKTIVDSCQSCKTGMSCFDYKSEESCLKNSCGASSGAKCQWMNTTYSSLGKGICYPPDYKGTDKCSLCSSSAGLFQNTFCIQQVCSKLGSCISKNSDSCESCTSNSICENFDSEASCTRLQNFEITKIEGCNITSPFRYSKDACNLGRCSWTGAKCVKDGNSDSLEDCQNSITPELCKRDNNAPETIVAVPQVVNFYETNLSFSIADAGSDSGGMQTYYCITNGSVCCPTTKMANNPLVLVNQIIEKPIFLRQGLNKIMYYSVDKNKNIEEIKTTNFFIDTEPPKVGITFKVSDYESTSAVDFSITLDEYAGNCFDQIFPQSGNPDDYFYYTAVKNLNNDNGTSFETRYAGLKDFTYDYIVNCTDPYGNSNNPYHENGHVAVEIDRVKGIISASPKNQTLKESSVKLSTTTASQASCEYSILGQDSYTRLGLEQTTQTAQANYTYSTTINNLQQGNYQYIARCDINGLIDYAKIYFTIDQTPPATLALDGKTFEQFDFSKSRNEYSIYLHCQDQAIAGFPSEFGCRETMYCFSPFADCNPNKLYDKPLTNLDFNNQEGHFCYKSADKGGNSESPKCSTITVDNKPPTISLELQTIITNNTLYVFKGSYDEDKDPNSVRINISWYLREDPNFFTSALGIKNIIDKTFNTTLKLYENTANNYSTNIIITRITDSAGNAQQSTSVIYLDHIPPVFTETPMITNDKNEKIQNPGTLDIYSEYGTSITFTAGINDTNWTAIDVAGQNNSAFVSIYCREKCKYNNTFELAKTSENKFAITIEPKKLAQGLFDLVPGNYTAEFSAYDKYKNKAVLTEEFKIIDRTKPKINITITNPSSYADSGIPVLMRGKIYNATIKTSEPVNISTLTYKVFNDSKNINPVSSTTLIAYSGDRTDWMYYFYINNSQQYDNLAGNNTEFIVVGQDNNGNQISQESIIDGRYFSIDTKAPGEITFDPEIPVYTTQQQLYITGFSANKEPGTNLDFFLNSAYNATTTSAKESKPIDVAQAYDPDNEFDKGKNIIQLMQNKAGTFTAGKYLDFNFRRLHNERYIIESSLFDQYTKITLSPSLEFDVSNLEDVYLYDEKVLTGWFGFDTILSLGVNTLEIVPQDSQGNRIWKSKANRTIIYDPEIPVIVSINPIPDSTSSDSVNRTTIILYDELSGISRESVVLTVNQAYHFCGTFPYTTPNDLMCTFEGKKLTVEYVNKNNGNIIKFPESRQNFTIYFEDIAKNSNAKSWYFEYNSKAPKTPRISIFGTNIFVTEQGKIFTPVEKPTFYTDFYKDRISIIEARTNFSGSILTSDTVESTTTIFTGINTNLAEGKEYLLGVDGIKKTGNESFKGQWNIPVEYDKTIPELNLNYQTQNFAKITNSLNNVRISGSYNEKNPDRIEMDGDVKEKATYTINSNAGIFELKANLSLPSKAEGTRKINVTIFDKAGNSKTINVDVKYDATGPELQVNLTNSNYVINYVVVGSNRDLKDKFETNINELNLSISANETSDINITLDAEEYIYSFSKIIEKTTVDSETIKLGSPTIPTNKKYSLRIEAKDLAGNTATKEYEILLDQKPPEITISQAFTNNASQEIVVTTNEDAVCYFNNIANIPLKKYKAYYTDNYQHTYIVENLAEGTLGFNVNCTDAAGNSAINWFNITKSTKKPELIVFSSLGANYNDFQEKNSYIIKNLQPGIITELKALAANNEEIICNYNCNGNKCDFKDSPFGSNSFFSYQNQSVALESPDRNGIYNYKISCSKKDSNSEEKNIILYVNATLPLIVEKTEPSETVASTALKIVTATNYLSYCQYNLDGIFRDFENQGAREHSKLISGLSEREYNIPVRCRRQPYGEYDAVSKITFTVSQTPPVPPIISSTTNPDQNKYYNNKTAIISWQSSQPATYTYYLLSLTENQKNEITTAQNKAVLADLADGNHIFYVRSRNNVGMLSDYASYNINIDATPPFSISLSGVPKATNAGVTISGQVFKTISEIEKNAKIEVYLNNKIEKLTTSDSQGKFNALISLNEGANTIYLKAYDEAGNGPAVSETKLIKNINEGPYITDYYPANNSVLVLTTEISAKLRQKEGAEINLGASTIILRNETAQISGEIRNNGVDEIKLIPNPMLSEGRYSFEISAKDSLGNTARQTYYFIIKKDANQIMLDYPFNKSSIYYSNNPKITISGKISGAATKLAIRARNTLFEELPISNDFSQEILLKEGKNVISIIAVSAEKALVESGDLTIYYNPKAPAIETTIPKNNFFINKRFTPYFGGIFGRYHANYYPEKIELSNNEAMQGAIANPYLDNFLFDINLTSGTNKIKLNVYDNTLNKGEDSINITLDAIPPVITITSVTAAGGSGMQENNAYKTNSQLISITGTFSDENIESISADGNPAAINSNNFNTTVEISESKKIAITAVDKGGNTNSTYIDLIKDNSAPEILSFFPEQTNIVNPVIKIKTSEKAFCNLTYNSSQGMKMQNFLITGENESSLSIDTPLNYDDSKALTITNSMVTCKDILGNEQKYEKQIIADLKKPVILNFYTDTRFETIKESTWEMRKYDVWGTLYTYATIIADEEVNCRYSNSSIDYNAMENNFSNKFSHMQTTKDIALKDKTNYTYYISCVDKAGNTASTKILILEVNKYIKIPIVNAYPQGYINTLSPVVSAQTYVNADCYADVAPTSFLSFVADWLANDVLGGYKKNESRMKKSFENDIYRHTTLISGVSDQLTNLKENNTYSINIRCTDPAGDYKDNKITLDFTPDVTPPTLQVTFRPDADYVENSLINTAGKTELNATISIYINNEIVRSRKMVNRENFDEDISLNEGFNEVKIVSVDKAGNTNSVSKTITYRNLGPTVLKLTPSSGIFNTLQNITTVIKDNGGGISLSQSRIELKLLPAKTTISGTQTTNGKNTIVFIPPDLQDGEYEIIATPYDLSGKMGRIEIAYFRIDKLAPSIRVTAPLDGSSFNTSILMYSGDISTSRDILNATIAITGNTSITVSDLLPYLNASKSYKKIQVTQEGKNIFVVRATTDIAVGETDTYKVIIDTIGPNVIDVTII